MEKQPLVISNKSCKTYFLVGDSRVYFSGDFDNGNLQKVEQISVYTYRVTPGYDKTRFSTKKTFFHFKVHGFKQCTVKFIVTKAHILKQFIKNQQTSQAYHPVARKQTSGTFEKIKDQVKIYYNSMDQPQISFSYKFQTDNWIQFAFSYPYTYEDNQNFINQMSALYNEHDDIYFYNEILCKTSQHRKVNVITITSKRNILHERQQNIEGIFGYRERPFKIDKPRVFITARVHPGQAPGSFCMQGIIRFLLNQKDYRSYLLRKNFHFILIPMVNPQGVYEGMFRNDILGENLNRMYVHCDQKKHLSIWSIKKYLQTIEKIDFFFDLHAHPSKKGFFIYGNAFDEFIEQIEAQIFSKMIEYNCPYFENLDCIYSQKAMVAKDKYDNYNKEGCARVYFYKMFQMIHSFTVECGYFSPTKLNPYPPQRQFTIPGSQYIQTKQWQNFSMKQYSPQSYMMLGKSILISLIDLFHINPYTRISTSDFKSINSLRKFTAQRIYNEVQRFRLIDSQCYLKMRQIAKLIEENYYIPRFKPYGLNISQNYGMKHRRKHFNINSRIYLNHKNKETLVGIKLQNQRLKNHEQQICQMEMKGMNLDSIGNRNYSIDHKIKTEDHPITEATSKQRVQSVQFQAFHQRKKSKIHSMKDLHVNQPSKHLKSLSQSYSSQSLDIKLPLSKLQVKQKIKKMQKQIINEFIQFKLKKQEQILPMKKKSDFMIKIDRLGSFLKSKGKQDKINMKFPNIHQHQNQK